MAFNYGAALAAFLASSAVPGTTVQTQGVEMFASVPIIEPAMLKGMMTSPTRFVLVDVRQPDEFAAGHIEGATLMPLDSLAESYAQLPRDVRLVVYCRSGHRSAQAVSFLRAHGYDGAVSLAGGFLAWTAMK